MSGNQRTQKELLEERKSVMEQIGNFDGRQYESPQDAMKAYRDLKARAEKLRQALKGKAKPTEESKLQSSPPIQSHP